jgi:beta-ureidopropionase / N-carbamoyl-L-amino-acid hydrolase
MKPLRQVSQSVSIDSGQLQCRIDAIASLGGTRLAYTPADVEARSSVLEMMRQLGLKTAVDAVGNLIGCRPGRLSLAPIAFGSHIDTVRSGGRYDGVLGVAAGLECLASLAAADYVSRHPLEIIVFANEEGQNFGALCGSRAMIGALSPEDLLRVDETGRTLAEAIKVVGGNPRQINSAIRQPGEMAAFLELHIEQGAVLESVGAPIGVVEGISGISYTEVKLSGMANHSGTTVMDLRKDALVAAAQFVMAVQEAARQGGCRVATVGRLAVHPNSVNIIPGEVLLTVELRDVDRNKILETRRYLRDCGRQISERTGVGFEFTERELIDPVPCSAEVQQAIINSCEGMGVRYHRLPSGAGHDAQMMGKIAPMGMIFVPSAGGVSHSPEEFTAREHCALGAEVLLQTILRLDRDEGRGLE